VVGMVLWNIMEQLAKMRRELPPMRTAIVRNLPAFTDGDGARFESNMKGFEKKYKCFG
jgi:hypothetical protein